MSERRRYTAWARVVILAAVATIALPWGSAAAQDGGLSVPLTDQIDAGTAEGDVVELTRISSGDFAGMTCSVNAVRGDSGASYVGNNLLITSRDSAVEIGDVDTGPDVVTTADAALRLDAVVVIELEMGSAEQFSGDVEVVFDCEPQSAAGEALTDQAAASSADATELPVSGQETTWALLVGVLLVLAGAVMLRVARPPGAIAK